jgi:O-6-methylguanine DNA methyltransferase
MGGRGPPAKVGFMSDAGVRQYRVSTDLGAFAVSFSDSGVCDVRFPNRSKGTATELRGQEGESGRNLSGALRIYASGRKAAFHIDLDLNDGTDFQQEVWEALRAIPYGEVRTYKQIAESLGRPKSARAVGAACAANPVPVVIPCHRVVASEGKLGGFSGGLQWKKKLLHLEDWANGSSAARA